MAYRWPVFNRPVSRCENVYISSTFWRNLSEPIFLVQNQHFQLFLNKNIDSAQEILISKNACSKNAWRLVHFRMNVCVFKKSLSTIKITHLIYTPYLPCFFTSLLPINKIVVNSTPPRSVRVIMDLCFKFVKIFNS